MRFVLPRALIDHSAWGLHRRRCAIDHSPKGRYTAEWPSQCAVLSITATWGSNKPQFCACNWRTIKRFIHYLSTTMRYYIIALFTLLITHAAMAQPKGQPQGIGKISGTVVDAQSGAPIEYATISLYVQATHELVTGTITDDKGRFALPGLTDDTYQIEASFIGYELSTRSDIVMEKERNMTIDAIALQATAIEVDEVVVEGERSLIEERVDRTVYNADQDDLAKGGDGADVLRKVPLLSVDLEGNVSLRGSSNITVLINNKPSTILASTVADALKMIPAEQIKKVEVITSPSAKYDAEGAGGIINIITKRNNLEGYYLNINTAAGLRGSNLGLNGSLRKGKFGMTLGGFGRAFYNGALTTIDQSTFTGGVQYLTQQVSDADDLGGFARYNLGLDYDIDNTQFLTAGVRYGLRSISREQLQSTELYANSILQDEILRQIEGINSSNSWDVNLDYLKKIGEAQEFSISTLYSRNDMNDNFTSDLLDDSEQLVNSLRNQNKNVNQELTFQTDYQTPIGENQQFEIGAKGIFRQVNSDFTYLLADASLDYQPSTIQPSGELDYQQRVSAGYASYLYSTPSKITIKVGARYEHTQIDATQNGQAIDLPSYANLVPSVNFSKTFKNFATIKAGYNRRIQRPWLQQLNPNVNILNAQDVRVGNPNLRPQLSDNFEVGFSKSIKKTYLNVSAFTRFSDNAINEVRFPIDSMAGAILTTYENIGREQTTGINLFANVNLSDRFSLNGGFDLAYAMLEGQIIGLTGETETAQNTGFNYGGRVMSQLKLSDGWSMQAFAMLRGRRVQLQGYSGGWGIYAIGVNKDFTNKKGSFGIAVENFATPGWKIRSELTTPQLSQVNNFQLYNRSIRINFSYQLGQMNFQNRRKTKSVQNDDLLGGGGGDNMSGGGGATPVPTRRSTRAARKKAAKSDQPALTGIAITGTWTGTAETPMGNLPQTFTFEVSDSALSGSVASTMGQQPLADGRYLDGVLTFTVSFGPYTIAYQGKVIAPDTIQLTTEQGAITLTRQQDQH